MCFPKAVQHHRLCFQNIQRPLEQYRHYQDEPSLRNHRERIPNTPGGIFNKNIVWNFWYRYPVSPIAFSAWFRRILTFSIVKVSWWRVFALLMIYSFNMAPNHIVVINRRGSYQDISGLILFTPGRPNKHLFAEFAQLWRTPETFTALSACFSSRKCLWICFHAAFEICSVLQHLRGQHALYLCINANRTHPLNIGLLKMTRVIFFCHLGHVSRSRGGCCDWIFKPRRRPDTPITATVYPFYCTNSGCTCSHLPPLGLKPPAVPTQHLQHGESQYRRVRCSFMTN